MLRKIPQTDDSERESLAVIVENEGKRVALAIDALLGQQQVVIKSLGAGLGPTPGFSGGAILPDGRVGLVIDVAEVINDLATESAEV